jgi:hypothetical protein
MLSINPQHRESSRKIRTRTKLSAATDQGIHHIPHLEEDSFESRPVARLRVVSEQQAA